MELAVEATATLAEELRRRRPWMHPFKLGEGAYVGTFKYHRLPDTVFLRSEPGLFADAARAFADVVTGGPFVCVDDALDRLGIEIGGSSFLDIACATGLYSFHLAALGAAATRGVEFGRSRSSRLACCKGSMPASLLPVCGSITSRPVPTTGLSRKESHMTSYSRSVCSTTSPIRCSI
jgi:hypothetical protein